MALVLCDQWAGKWHIKKVGRGKITRDVEVKNGRQLMNEVSKHLMSRDVEIQFDDSGLNGTVVVGGMRPCGEVSRIEGVK